MARTKQIKNFTLNFGPQHPAAHGVLRLVLNVPTYRPTHDLFIHHDHLPTYPQSI